MLLEVILLRTNTVQLLEDTKYLIQLGLDTADTVTQKMLHQKSKNNGWMKHLKGAQGPGHRHVAVGLK